MLAAAASAHGMSAVARGYWIEAPGRGAIRDVVLPRAGDGDVERVASCSGISPGTERLVATGAVPAALDAVMAVPGMQGSFALPILYGYAFVGAVRNGPRAGARAFTMHPHCERAVAAAARCVWLPDDVPDARATLFANLETAVNAVWDGAADEGAALAIVGAGAVGLLIAFVLAQRHRGEIVLAEASPSRRAFAASLGWARTVCAPDELPRDHFAAVFHASGTAAGLQLAIDAAGFEGRIVDLAWYGDRAVSLQLGVSFHHRRKVLLASQVGTVASQQRARGHAFRTATVLELLRDARLDALVPDSVRFDALPEFFARVYRHEPTPTCPVVRYEPA